MTAPRRALPWVGAALAAVAAALLSSWPAALHAGRDLYGDAAFSDSQAALWWCTHVPRALLALQDPFQARELRWPEGQDVSLLVWNLLPQLLFAPIFLLFQPILAMNLAALATQVLNGLACAWAGRALGAGPATAAAAAALAGASSYGWVESGFGRFEQSLWAPLAVFLGALLAGRPRLAGAALAAAGAIYWFYAYFGVLVTVGWCLAAPRVRLRAAVEVALVSALCVSPFLLPLLVAAAGPALEARALLASAPGATTMQSAAATTFPLDWFWPLGARSPQFGARMSLLLLPAAIFGLLRGGAARWLGATAAFALACSAGPWLIDAQGDAVRVGGQPIPLPMQLVNDLPGMGRFWWSYRWLGLAIPAAIVLAQLLLGRATWLLVPLAVGEGAWLLRGGPGGATPVHRPVPVSPVLAALAELEEAPILQLPPTLPNAYCGWIAFHRQPVDGGLLHQLQATRSEAWRRRAATLPLHAALFGEAAPAHAPGEAWTLAETGGFHYVVLWKGEAPPGETEARRGRARATLGEPFHEDPQSAWWAIPGVSRPLVLPP